MDLDEITLAVVEVVDVAGVFFIRTRWSSLPRVSR
jgi:hypothetical protein